MPSDDIRVPDSGDLALGPAVSRQSRSFQSVLGVGFLVAASSWTLDAWSAGEVDYVDMNGDLFPDVVSGGHIQYTSPRGGLEAARRAVDGLAGDDVRETDISSWNFGLGANAVYSRGDAQGKAGASSGQRLRLAERGMPRMHGWGRGDLYVQVKIVVPRNLSQEERELIERLGKMRKESPRANLRV